jgi:hypothetical protein
MMDHDDMHNLLSLYIISPPALFYIKLYIHFLHNMLRNEDGFISRAGSITSHLKRGVNMLGHIVTKKGEEKHKMMSLDNKT